MSSTTRRTKKVPANYLELALFMAARPGPQLMVAVLCGSVFYKSVWGTWDGWDLVIIAFFFSLRGILEWLIHACLYHGCPVPLLGFRMRTGIHEMHLKHHQDPTDYETFLLTTRGISVAAVFTLVFFSLFLNVDRAMSFVFAVMMLLFIIEVVHLMGHSDIYPGNRFIARILAIHRRHHQINDGRLMGVSSTLGDRLFGTFPYQ